MRMSPRIGILVLSWLAFVGTGFAKSSSSVAFSSSLNPSTYAVSVTFTATVTPAAATGTVTFKDGTTTLGTGTLSSGKTTFSTSTLAGGSHSITAVYGGNTTYNGSTSSALSQTVNKANSTITIASSANPSTFGASVKFTAALTPSTATGTVTFTDGSTTLGTGTVSGGKATLSVSTLAVGSHSITAAYGGSTNYNSSTSSALTQTVNKANSTVTVASSSNPSAVGSLVTFTATISSTTATGTVTFIDGSTALGTGTISIGKAAFSTSTLAIGSHSITAVYGGDSNYNGSTSAKLSQAVKQASAVALTSSTNPCPSGAPVAFTATVAPSAATGTVTFLDGSTSLGTASLSGGIANFATSNLALGSHSITASYSGDSNDVGSTSAALTQKVLALTSISIAPATASLPEGATLQFVATATFSDSSQGNINASATWSSSNPAVAMVSPFGLVTGVDEGSTSIQANVGSVSGSATVTGTQTRFRLTGKMGTGRSSHTATSLLNGKVLIAGGETMGGSLAQTVELYDPVSGIFSATGAITYPRYGHTATLLANGKVLIAGGVSLATDGSGTFVAQLSAELYDPATGGFSRTGSLNTGRQGHSATLLQNGQILIAGGEWDGSSSAELYDPVSGIFTYTGNLTTYRQNHSATILKDGTVLIAGGSSGNPPSFSSAEIYSPSSGTFSATGSLNGPRDSQTATLLSSGKVLIAGGENLRTGPLASAELYDPIAKVFSLTGSLASARTRTSATLLNDGNVLVAGGAGNANSTLATAEVYDASTGAFSLAGSMIEHGAFHTATLLNDGTVLIAGGNSLSAGFTSSAEIYDPINVSPSSPPSLQISPATANLLVGGIQQFNALDNHGVPRQDVTWSVSDPNLATLTIDGDGNGLLTGVAAGRVTLTAAAGTTSIQEIVNILGSASYSPGTTIWSAPPIAGFTVQQIAQAVPTNAGPDLYSIQSNSTGTQSIVQALTADGRQLMQAALPPIKNAVPDGNGGLLVTEYDTCASGQTNPLSVVDLDSSSGQPIWQVQAAGIWTGQQYLYCYGNGYDAPQIAVRGDGAVIISAPNNSGFPQLTLVYPNGSQQSATIAYTTITNPNGTVITTQCCVGPPMVNVDGTTYVEYEIRNINNHIITSDSLYLKQILPNGIWTSGTLLSSTTQDEALLPGPIVPDGQGGIIATWTISPSNPPVLQYPYQAVDVVNGAVGAPYNLPFSPPSVKFGDSPTIVLGENGTAFASGHTTSSNTPIDQVVSFNINSGAPNWSFQGTAANQLSITEATTGNGLSAKNTDSNGNDTVLNFNPNGTLSDQLFGALSNVDYYNNGRWIGLSNGTAVAVVGDLIQEANSSYPHKQGNGSKQNSHSAVVANFETVDPVFNPTQGQSAAALQTRYNSTKNFKGTSLSVLTRPTFAVYSDASFSNYVNQVFKPIEAVAFIGHSLQTSGSATGVCFGQQGTDPQSGLPLFPCYSTGTGGYGFQYNGAYYQVTGPLPSLGGSQAKIIFWAACDLGTAMQNLLGITNSTVGRALLFPQSATDIDLDMGEFEWLQILANLESGQNLQQAVANANATTAAKKWYITVNGVQTQVPAQAWQVIGDSGNGGAGIHF